MASSWRCPSCNSPVEAQNEEGLFWAVRRHIADHETQAALRAVDRARASCSQPYCGIARLRVSGPDGLPLLTDFDKGFLRTMKVGWTT